MKLIEKIRSRLNIRKALKGTAIFLIVFSLVGFLILPPVVKSVLLDKLSEQLKREITIGTVKVNPFMFSVKVRGVEIRESNSQKPFISFDELYLNLQTLSIFKQGLIIKEIRLVNPYFHIVRNEDLTYNFSDLLAMAKKKPEAGISSEDEREPLRYSLNNIQIINAAIDFMDLPMKTGHEVREAMLGIPLVSNLPYHMDHYIQPEFSAKINGHAVGLKGSTKPFADSLETNIELDLKDLNIPYYLAYSPIPMNYTVVSGLLDLQATMSYVQQNGRSPAFSMKGNASLKKVRIDDRAGRLMISLDRLDSSLSSPDLMAGNLHFAKIAVQSPDLNVSLDKAGGLNLMALAPKTKGRTKAEERQSLPIIAADEVALSDGKIMFTDESAGRNFKTALLNIQAKISRFSTQKDAEAEAEVSFQTDTKEEIKLAGAFSVGPVKGKGTAELKQVILKKYEPYYRKSILFSVEQGSLDMTADYTFFLGGSEPDITVSGVMANLVGLRLRRHGDRTDFLGIPSLSLKETSVDLAGRKIVLGELSSHGGKLIIERMKDGRINLETLLPVPEDSSARSTAARKQNTSAGTPWAVTIKKIALDRYALKAEDQAPSEPVNMTFDNIRFRGDNISTEKGSRGNVSLAVRIERKGAAWASGAIGLEPAYTRLHVKTKDIPIMPAVPYFSDRIKIIVSDGTISSDGTLAVGFSKDSPPMVSYKGMAAINKFASVDKADAQDFLKWDSLHLDEIDASYNPLVVKIDEVALSDFYSRIIINADSSINLQNIIEKDRPEVKAEGEQQAETTAEAGEKIKEKLVTIGRVTLQGGTVNFSDYFIKPQFSTNMLEIGGRVTGLSSEEARMADVELRGKLDNYAPLEITGRINPLRDDLFVDLNISFRDMDLSPLTPYSGRYLGYVIEKGKLGLNLHYLIEKKKLDSENRILLNQFTLGSAVESPEATKLPVKLAIALLKDRKGNIDLDIPVSGRIDDPQFSLGRIIIKILVNLIVKAVTSPFALLGSIFGGGEELSYVEFDYGRSSLGEAGVKKINTMIKALHDRPSLKIEIEGHVDTDKDREGLKQLLFSRKVKAQKLKDMIGKDAEAVPVDEIKVEQAEYENYLWQAYKAEEFPKPRNFIGMVKRLPVAEMEKLMLTNIEIKEGDLRMLASQRALAIKDQIIKSKLVEQERIFLVEPKTLQPDRKETVKDSRVDFRLK